MENNERSNEAESLFATKRKQQMEAEAEKKRMEELAQQKQQMEAEVKRLEALKAAQMAQQQQQPPWAQQQQQQPPWAQQQQTQWAAQPGRPAQQQGRPFQASGMTPAGAQKGPSLKTKKIALYILVTLGVVMGLLFLIGSISDTADDIKDKSEPEPEPAPASNDEPSDVLAEDWDDSDLLYFNGHAYEYVDMDLAWMDAREYCREQGGHLVTITSPEEQDFLADNFYGQMLWIGAFGSETGWRWVTDEEWYYENWAPGEPNGGEEWCGCFWTDMKWNDLREADPGERISAFICEYDDFTDYGDY